MNYNITIKLNNNEYKLIMNFSKNNCVHITNSRKEQRFNKFLLLSNFYVLNPHKFLSFIN